jgi:hypothetical protein
MQSVDTLLLLFPAFSSLFRLEDSRVVGTTAALELHLIGALHLFVAPMTF